MHFAHILVAVATLIFCTATNAEQIQVGSLRLNWTDGFTSPQPLAQPPIELRGPNGEAMLVTIMRQRVEPPMPGDPAEQEKMAAFGERFLISQARKAGTITVELTGSRLPNGTLLRHIGASTSKLFSTGYFSQYLLVSPVGRLAFITVEGKGESLTEHSKFLSAVSTAEWTE